MNKKISLLFIAIGATLWGIIGIFVTYLYEIGFTPVQVVAVRTTTAALFLVFYVSFKNRELLKIKLIDSKYFVGTGIISIVFFNWCLFSAIEETSISIATILLYTAPAFVTIIARIVFKELFTVKKLVSLAVTISGCALVIGVFPASGNAISTYGFVLGIGSGFFYALYSIFGKMALKKYDSLTITVYTFVFAALAIIPFSQLWTVGYLFLSVEAWLNIVGLGLLSTMLAFIFYTAGLSQVESSQASIIATIEPVVASLASFLIFQEKLDLMQYIGIVMVIFAVILVQKSNKKHKVHVKNTENHSL